ncbi:MAG: hypothetical protein QOE63_1218 [Acidimicrobiaceae bacterium]|jgi:peptidoglycan/LPS O-acetylase OafA/YrhL
MDIDDRQRPAFRLGYRPQLDGLRALAVLAVMGFHASITTVQGGYLGVDVFFVLSGFLITVLLAQEHAAHGDVRLRWFYARRALRLLPALFGLLVAVAVYALIRPNEVEMQGVGGELLGAALYVANWVYALRDTFTTHILSHTWSLAIEEQFYLLWPFVLVWLIKRRHGLDGALVAASAGAVGLTAWRVALYRRGASLPHISYGLDTRAAALMMGAAIGLAAVTGRLRLPVRIARVVGLVGFAWLLYIFLSHRYGIGAIAFDPGREFVEGILVVDLATSLLLVGLLFDDRGPLRRLFSLAPVVLIGKVSYGLYLWHFPIDEIVTPDRTGLSSPLNQVVRLVITIAVVSASYLLIEQPALRVKQRFERDRLRAADAVSAP